jgi:hypothetical protein
VVLVFVFVAVIVVVIVVADVVDAGIAGRGGTSTSMSMDELPHSPRPDLPDLMERMDAVDLALLRLLTLGALRELRRERMVVSAAAALPMLPLPLLACLPFPRELSFDLRLSHEWPVEDVLSFLSFSSSLDDQRLTSGLEYSLPCLFVGVAWCAATRSECSIPPSARSTLASPEVLY